MIRATLLAALFLAVVGCNRSIKVDNPVAPDPPPRISFNDSAADAPTDQEDGKVRIQDTELDRDSGTANDESLLAQGGIKRVRRDSTSGSNPSGIDELGNATGVVVMVNGQPIFAEDVLNEFHQQLAAAEQAVALKRAPPEALQKLRAGILRRRLPVHIESKLLSAAMLSGLKKEQKESLKVGLEEAFQKQIEKQKADMGITSQGEFEVMLAKHGMTMERLRQANDERAMAQQYVAMNAGPPVRYTHRELLDYYQEHQEDYAITGKVKWRHLYIDIASRGEQDALNEINNVVQKLIDGAKFEDLAREHSDGATASSGGLWDWTEQGSLADEDIERTLFRIPVGTVSDVIKTDSGYQIVKVLDRVDSGYRPFSEVQNEINNILQEQRMRTAANDLIAQLKRTAVIESKYNLDGNNSNQTAEAYEVESNVEFR